MRKLAGRKKNGDFRTGTPTEAISTYTIGVRAADEPPKGKGGANGRGADDGDIYGQRRETPVEGRRAASGVCRRGCLRKAPWEDHRKC